MKLLKGHQKTVRAPEVLMMKATIFDIQRNSFVDGPGIRTTVFLKGCNLKCAWCHNPESQSAKTQMMFYKNKCVNCGKCREICPNELKECNLCGKCTQNCLYDARKICGREYSVDEVFNEIVKDKIFFDNSGGGVTFSGGECMLQIDFLSEILKRCQEDGIHTAVDTAGNVSWEYFEKILQYTDLFLYDVKCMTNEKHKKYIGAENILILENLNRLLKTDKKVWIRVPVISGVNDTEEEMQKLKNFLKENGKPEKIELLPYHEMGEHKYDALGKCVTKFKKPENDNFIKLKSIFSDMNF